MWPFSEGQGSLASTVPSGGSPFTEAAWPGLPEFAEKGSLKDSRQEDSAVFS